MNLFSDVRDLKIFEEYYPHSIFVYSYLLSKAVEKNGTIYAPTLAKTKLALSGCLPAATIEECFVAFEDDGIIVASRVGTSIGSVVDGNNVLHIDAPILEHTLTNEFKQARNLVSAYEKVAKRGGRVSNVFVCKKNLSAITDKFQADLTYKDIVNYFLIIIQAWYQEKYRDLTAAEYGRFKNLHRSFGAPVCIKMIHEFVVHSEKYCYNGAEPNVSLLMYNKDTLYAIATGKAKTKRSRELRTGSSDSTTSRWKKTR